MPARAVIPGVPDEAQDRTWEVIDGAILLAGRRARNHNQKLSRKNVLLHMARIDNRALGWFQKAYSGPMGWHAQATRISRVLEPEKFSRRVASERQQARAEKTRADLLEARTGELEAANVAEKARADTLEAATRTEQQRTREEKARADTLEAATVVPGVPGNVHYGDVLPVVSFDDSDSSPSWVKWASRLIGAPFVAVATLAYFFEPRLGIVLLPFFCAFWVGMLLWERRDSRRAQGRRPVRYQYGLPTKPGNSFRLVADRADGRSVVVGEYVLGGTFPTRSPSSVPPSDPPRE